MNQNLFVQYPPPLYAMTGSPPMVRNRNIITFHNNSNRHSRIILLLDNQKHVTPLYIPPQNQSQRVLYVNNFQNMVPIILINMKKKMERE